MSEVSANYRAVTEQQTPSPPAGDDRQVRRRPSLGTIRRRDAIAPYLFLAPWLLGFVGVTLGPMIASLYLSLTDYNLFSTPQFIGFDNYIRMFTADPKFWISVRVTLIYVVTSVPLQLGIALALAVLLNRGLRGLPFYRSMFYIPSLIGGSVAIAVLWRQMFGNDGLVNQILGFFGIEHGSWLGDPSTSLWVLVLLNGWAFGSPMVIFLAALRQVPSFLYEAAAMDGAGPIRRFWSITVPMITPVLFFNLVLQLVNAFQAFTPAFVVSSGTGGPINSTLFYTLYLYQRGFTNFEMGYASAMAWVLVITVGAVTALNFRLSRLWVHYDD